MDSEVPAWYCVRCRQKQEHIAAANVRQLGLEVFNPRVKFRRATQRGPVWFTEPLFPNYIFARFPLRQHLNEVRHATGVSTVVHFADRIPSISNEIIADLRQITGDQEIIVRNETPEPGQQVRIASGPFRGLLGDVHEILPAPQRVCILLEILGRQTTVQLSAAAIVSGSSTTNRKCSIFNAP